VHPVLLYATITVRRNARTARRLIDW
jgi:hypothetical protein